MAFRYGERDENGDPSEAAVVGAALEAQTQAMIRAWVRGMMGRG